jgi:GTP-binding protein
MLPVLALVGRPNVGKSTLFNRIAGKRLSIVDDTPGVTRDRHYAEVEHEGRLFRICDTGGFTPNSTELLVAAVREQALVAIAEAAVIILVMDARAGLTAADSEVLQLLRRGGKPVFIAANKMDSWQREQEADLAELYATGMDVFPISAEHNRGVGEMLDAVLTHLKDAGFAEEKIQGRKARREEEAAQREAASARALALAGKTAGDEADPEGSASFAEAAEVKDAAALEGGLSEEDALDTETGEPSEEESGGEPGVGDVIDEPTELEGPADDTVRLAVLGRPNVGKSTLLNKLLGEERFVASALPGTTRDAVDEELTYAGRTFVLTDTAGLRKKRQVIDKVEVFSAQRALKAVEAADVVVVLTDASELGVEQDARIAAQAEERGRAVILVVNKWDMVKDKEAEAERLREEAKRHLQFVGYAPLLFVSALEGTRVQKILEVAAELHDEASTRLPTPALNAWVQEMQDSHPAPLWNGFPVRFSYAWQVARQPITIAIQCSRPHAVDESYRRFLLGRLRERFNLRVPVRLVFKKKSRSQPRGVGGPRGINARGGGRA